MKILVIGGTLFLGRVYVETALAQGHDVTLFNRGRTNPHLFSEATKIVGDRDGDLAGLAGLDVDAVVDTSAYFPRQVTAVLDALGAVGHYTMVSSCSVYADHSAPNMDETAPVATVADPSVEQLGEDYGGFKALCEEAAEAALPGNVLHVRAGLIVGPHDNTNRFTYWVRRIADGGEVLAPEDRQQPVQFIDVRDLSEWMLRAAADGTVGVMNANRPPGQLTMEDMLTQIRDALNTEATFTWVGEDLLMEQEVGPWMDLPLWLPHRSMPTHVGFLSHDTSRARATGLTIRSVADTARATLAWLRAEEAAAGERGESGEKDFGNPNQQAGISAERERELISLWKDQRSPG